MADSASGATTSASYGRDLHNGVSVIVPSHRGRHHLPACLRSLADQTLEPDLFEVIVVLNGEPDGSRSLVDQLCRANPRLRLEVLELPEAGVSAARNAGLATASHRYTAFVDDDDTVSPAYLETLLAHAGAGVIPLGQIMDVSHSGHAEAATPINTQSVRHAGQIVHPDQVPRAFGFNACKLVPTSIARRIGYDTALRSGVDVVFFNTLLARHAFDVAVCPVDNGPGAGNAVYYRRVRPGSISRQVPSFEFTVVGRMEVISRVASLVHECDDERRSRVLRTTISSQANLIGTYLAAHPDEAERVFDTIAPYGIDDFPYHLLARDRARTLVVSYCFPPYDGTAGIVAAKRVRQRGEIVDVVYNAMDSVRRVDPDTSRIAEGLIDRDLRLPTPTGFASWRAVETFCAAGLAALHPDAGPTRDYQRVHSRVTWPASHFLAATYKLRHPEVRWSAEFSDPVSHGIDGCERVVPVGAGELLAELRAGLARQQLPVPETRNAYRWCEYLAYALADELVFTNENQRDFMLGYCELPELASRAREVAVIHPQPVLPRRYYHAVDSSYRLEPDVINLAYFGAFYATRGLDDVLAALAALPADRRRRLLLHVFTNTPQALGKRAADLGVTDRVAIGPYVPYLEFLNLTSRFDWLIVNDARTADTHSYNPYLPSKWADYRGSGTAVWGLIEPGSPLSAQPLDHSTPLGDVAAARRFLESVTAVVPETPGDPASVEGAPHDVGDDLRTGRSVAGR